MLLAAHRPTLEARFLAGFHVVTTPPVPARVHTLDHTPLTPRPHLPQRYISTAATPTFIDCVFRNVSALADGGLFNLKDESSLTLRSPSVASVTSVQGACVFSGSSGTHTIVGGSFDGCVASGDGGSVYLSHGRLVATGTSFLRSGASEGAAAFVKQDASFDCDGCAFEEGVATLYGGAIATSFGTPAVRLNGSFCLRNVAIESGGCVHTTAGVRRSSTASPTFRTDTQPPHAWNDQRLCPRPAHVHDAMHDASSPLCC